MQNYRLTFIDIVNCNRTFTTVDPHKFYVSRVAISVVVNSHDMHPPPISPVFANYVFAPIDHFFERGRSKRYNRRDITVR